MAGTTGRVGLNRGEWLKDNRAQQGGSVRASLGRRQGGAIANVRGAPQVIFKVVRDGGCHGPRGAAAQFDYVLGKADRIIDPVGRHDGRRELPTEQSLALADEWASDWSGRADSGQTMHLIASFPRGSRLDAVENVVRATCHEILDQGRGRFEYIAAVHSDREHPHAHIIVNRRNPEGELFHFARGGEFTYDLFKDALVKHGRDYGLLLSNTPRVSRGLLTDPLTDAARRGHARSLTGVLVANGHAPYKNDPRGKASYFVEIATDKGTKTLWGIELRRAIETAEVSRGDRVAIDHQGKRAVTVTDRNGQPVETHRNDWVVRPLGRSITNTPTVSQGRSETRPTTRQRLALDGYIDDYRRTAESASRLGLASLSAALSSAARALDRGEELPEPNQLHEGATVMAAANANLTAGAGSRPVNNNSPQPNQYELYDPTMETRYSFRSPEAAMEKADDLGASRFQRIHADGSVEQIHKVEGRWPMSSAEHDLGTSGPGADTSFSARVNAEADEMIATIERSKENLAQVRQDLDQIAPVDRPQIEASYYAAMRELQELESGRAAPELDTPAGGTIYERDGNDWSDEAYDRLTEAGLNADVIRARHAIENPSQALEARWVADDARSIAGARGYDFDGQEGRAQAYQALADAYDRAGAEVSTVAEREELHEAAGALAPKTSLGMIEERPIEVVQNRIRALADRDDLSTDEQRELIELVDNSLDARGRADLARGDISTLREFGNRETQIEVADSYLRAREAWGEDHTDGRAVIKAERDVHTAERDIADREARETHERDGHERDGGYGL